MFISFHFPNVSKCTNTQPYLLLGAVKACNLCTFNPDHLSSTLLVFDIWKIEPIQHNKREHVPPSHIHRESEEPLFARLEQAMKHRLSPLVKNTTILLPTFQYDRLRSNTFQAYLLRYSLLCMTFTISRMFGTFHVIQNIFLSDGKKSNECVIFVDQLKTELKPET